MFKALQLVMGAKIQYSRLSCHHHHHPGCVRTTRSPGRPCIPACVQHLSSPTLYRQRTAAAMEPLPLLLPTLLRVTAATITGH
jgi:hypothetical protein